MHIDITELSQQLEASIPTIDERLFQRDFLPFFTQQISPEQVPQAVSAWVMGVAGSSSTPVNVIDPTTGNVLFKVPALIDTSRLTVKNGERFEYAMAVYNAYSRNQPERAEQLAMRELREAAENELEIESTSGWTAMLQYYNLVPTETAQPAAPSTGLLDDLGI